MNNTIVKSTKKFIKLNTEDRKTKSIITNIIHSTLPANLKDITTLECDKNGC